MNQTVVLCGLGQVGWRVLDFLRAAGIAVVAIDNKCSPDDPRLKGVRLVHGDCRQREVLEQAGLNEAFGVLVVTSDDLANISTTLMVRHLNPQIRVVVRVFNQNLLPRLGKAVANVFALSTSALTAPLLALTALTGESLGAFSLEEGRRQIAELSIREGSNLVGQTIATVTAQHGVEALAHLPASGQDRFLADIDPQARLTAGDRLVACGEPRVLGRLLEVLGEEPLPGLHWAGWTRRQTRALWRTLAEVDLSVKICTAALFIVVLISTLVYTFGIWEGERSWTDGLYRTVSLIATGSDMQEGELKHGWQKVFVSILRIMGAALTAAFTAIVTNYLLRARLGGALEIRRIPDSGHIIVCGLGNVGFRVVEELLQYGEQVVVIERSRDSRFFATARRLGVAVIVGDATVLEVLRQAHAATARAVVVATSNELANLEIALLSRELNPRQRVVVRLGDPYLAQTLRLEANVGLALSIPDLAAPAFVAALYGDRVQCVFIVRGRMFAVIDIVVQPEEAFLVGQEIRQVTATYGLLPIAISVPNLTREQLWSHRLKVTDRLTVITSLPDLERFIRRQPRSAGVA